MLQLIIRCAAVAEGVEQVLSSDHRPSTVSPLMRYFAQPAGLFPTLGPTLLSLAQVSIRVIPGFLTLLSSSARTLVVQFLQRFLFLPCLCQYVCLTCPVAIQQMLTINGVLLGSAL